MANKFIRVNINHKGFIPILGCFGPVKNILLTEVQVNNIKRIIGEDRVELVNKPKKVITPRQAEEIRKVKQEPMQVNPEVRPEEPIKEEVRPQPIKEEVKPEPTEEKSVEEEPKPAPKRRRRTTPKKVEEEEQVANTPEE